MSTDRIQHYREESEVLFRDWKRKKPENGIDHGNNVFVSDGVVCPERWFSQEIRPLFLLKEAYNWKSEGDLIRDHLLTDEAMKKDHITWRRVTQWTRGILNTTENIICPFCENSGNLRFGNEYLQQIAAVNIKKSNGKSTSDDADILAYARYDREELRKQISLIDPTVIICGYTCDYLSEILECDIKAERNQNLYYFISLNGHDVIVLDYWHPCNRYPDLMFYYGLMAIYQQALCLKSAENHK